MGTYSKIEALYNQIRKNNIDELNSSNITKLLEDLSQSCTEYLKSCKKVPLISKVVGKDYFTFISGNKQSRAVRTDLYTSDLKIIKRFFSCLITNKFTAITPLEIDKACYTVAISFCAIVDLEKVGDQKTTGTFFEYFIGHCFAVRLAVNPRSKVDVLNLDKKTTLPTDLIFDLGPNRPKFHVPIKISTRERVIQVWAHQRVLDGVYGTGRFYGTLACLSETKTDKVKKEVIEICLPQQWQLYQMFIAQMKRVYYLDLPLAYSKLNDVFPKIHVNTLSSFFIETEDLANFD